MNNCAVCGKRITILSKIWEGGRKFDDNFICGSCVEKAGVWGINFSNSRGAIEIIKKRITDFNMFNATRQIESYIKIDDNNKFIKIEGKAFKFSDILSYDFTMDGETIKKGGGAKAVSNAIVGGVLFGGVGAIAGAAMGLPKNKEQCTSMKINVQLKDCVFKNVAINFVTFPVKVDGIIFKGAIDNARKCCTILDEVITNNNY